MQDKFRLPQFVISELVLRMKQLQDENITLFKCNVLNIIYEFDDSSAMSKSSTKRTVLQSVYY